MSKEKATAVETKKAPAAKAAAKEAPAKTEVPPAPAPSPAPAAAPAADAGPSASTGPNGEKLVVLKGPIVVKDLAALLGLKPFQLIHHLMEMNVFATLTQVLDEEAAKKGSAQRGFTFNAE